MYAAVIGCADEELFNAERSPSQNITPSIADGNNSTQLDNM